MIINKNLQYAIIGKFSYGWSEIQDLRKLIFKQYELKRDCKIELFSTQYILTRASLLEVYVYLLSKSTFYITRNNISYSMMTLKLDLMFNPDEETSTTIAWISFSSLPPNFFGEEAIFSLAIVVDKSFQVDMKTKNKTRPSYARIKMKVDLLGEFLKELNQESRRAEER